MLVVLVVREVEVVLKNNAILNQMACAIIKAFGDQPHITDDASLLRLAHGVFSATV